MQRKGDGSPITVGDFLSEVSADRERYTALLEKYHTLLGNTTAELQLFRSEKEQFFDSNKENMEYLFLWANAQKAKEDAKKKQIEAKTKIELAEANLSAEKFQIVSNVISSPSFRDALIGIGLLLAIFKDALLGLMQ